MGSLTTECLCGKTSLELSGKPRFQVLCHCTICQKLTGSGDMHAVIGSCTAVQRRLMACHAIENEVMHLKHAKVKVVKGQDSFLKYKSSDPLTRHMCDACGCHMFGKLEGDTPNIAVPMGTVKRSTDANQPEFKPQCHIFYGTRINDMHDDLPKWSGFMDDSKRLG